MNKLTRAYIELHFAVVLFGFAAIFGALISVSAVALVWWRLLISVIFFLFIKSVYKEIRLLDQKQIIIFLGIGVITCIHWICFYGSIKLANASVGLICFSATPFFTSLIEPLLNKSQPRKTDMVFGMLIVPAMFLILTSLDFSMYTGVIVGMVSSLFAAVFTSLNKKYIDVSGPMTILFLELFGALIFLSFLMPIIISYGDVSYLPEELDWVYLIGLSIFCTVLAFGLMLKTLKHVSAFTSNFIISLEPVYGIILAIVLLKEHRALNVQFYLGVMILMILVLSYPYISKKMARS